MQNIHVIINKINCLLTPLVNHSFVFSATRVFKLLREDMCFISLRAES